jgi:pyruvate,water dikinase
MAFPGLFKTILGLSSVTSVADAVEEVVSSLTSDAVEAYALHHRRQSQEFRMAVLIQHMLNPQSSGVAFSRHPTGSREMVAIEATYGLGAPLVDGRITPDLVLVDESGRTDFVRIGSKRIRASLVNTHVQYDEATEDDRRRPAITIRDARSIACMARHLEATLGEPQDIEWAIENHRLYLLQSRPITTLAVK